MFNIKFTTPWGLFLLAAIGAQLLAARNVCF